MQSGPISELYERFGSMVYHRCLEILGEDDAAIDAMQDVFVKVIEMGNVDIHSPSSLLYIVATRTCLNAIRRRERRPESAADQDLIERIASLSDTEGVSHSRMLLSKLFGRNPESSRVIAMLHYVDGLTHQEVAREVGMSVSGVRHRLRVLRADLQTLEAES